MGLYRQPYFVVALRFGVELWIPRYLGTEHDPDHRGIPDPHPRWRQRRGLDGCLLFGFVLWPFVTVALQQSTGSFALAFLCIPVFMIAMAVGVWMAVPEHTGKELDAIIV